MLKITLLPTIRDNGGVHKALEAANETDDLVVTLLAGDRLKRNQPSKHFCLLNVHYSSKWRIPSLIVASFIWLFWLQIFKYKKGNCQITYTHFSTFLCVSFLCDCRCFIQGLEWNGINSPLKKKLMKIFILGNYKFRSWTLYAASNTLKNSLESDFGVQSILAPVWASHIFKCKKIKLFTDRKYDLCMVVRNIPNKRPDLYRKIIESIPKKNSIITITPDREIYFDSVFNSKDLLFNGTADEIKNAYCDSKFILHLSDYEGFGLPPLEAMGCGTIPLCRDSRGVRNYLYGNLEKLIMPFDEILSKLSDTSGMSDYSGYQHQVVERFLSVDDRQFIRILNSSVKLC